MTPGSKTLRPMIALAAIVLAAAAAILLLTRGPASAEAGPRAKVRGQLGFGAVHTIPPFTYEGDGKIDSPEQPSGSENHAMRSVAQMTPTPLPVAPKPAPKKPAAKKVARKSAPKKPAPVSTSGWKTAKVTWYGPGFYGNKTASGMILKQDSMIVAHRTLPFGTKIQFEYKGRTCTAIVADRGPNTRSLEFDLGPGTAKALGFSGKDTVRYRFVK